ncbi:MotE family protein [Pectinatus cerevisiiphilus]|uniref:MgtE-like protein n=1 Tax=Pectinatus cerevisiiphilus TaxID=86956 RepID=A0A4R3KCI9_9FIRM|nr:magnesium transporter MgtE [Pectinatus cerevisiiphilus]TCS80946.1 MgtE-like protein [Pectinatus cerevisiiphilus]
MAKSPAGSIDKQTIKNQQISKKTVQEKTKPKKALWKKILLIILIVILLAGGFFLGIYLRILDTDKMNKSLHLYNWPIIGENFVKPSDETTQQDDETAKTGAGSKDGTANNASAAKPGENGAVQSKPVTLTKKQLEEQKKAREAEVNKRVGKLSRIYAQMDPQKAADILSPLDDNVVASILQKMDDARSAKVMEAFDASRAAQITQILYNGLVPPTLPQLDNAENAAANKAQ